MEAASAAAAAATGLVAAIAVAAKGNLRGEDRTKIRLLSRDNKSRNKSNFTNIKVKLHLSICLVLFT